MRGISAHSGMYCMMVRPCSDLRLFSSIARIRLATCNATPPWKSVCALLSPERGVTRAVIGIERSYAVLMFRSVFRYSLRS